MLNNEVYVVRRLLLAAVYNVLFSPFVTSDYEWQKPFVSFRRRFPQLKLFQSKKTYSLFSEAVKPKINRCPYKKCINFQVYLKVFATLWEIIGLFRDTNISM